MLCYGYGFHILFVPCSAAERNGHIYESPDYGKRYFDDRILVTGHTPTVLISPESRGKIFKSNGHIAIDCGATFGMGLGCIRLDDMKEFYIE